MGSEAVEDAGVAAIPVSAFYEADKVTSIARLCFSKGDATLDEGGCGWRRHGS